MPTITLEENGISVTADTMRQAKKLLASAIKTAEETARQERVNQDMANSLAQSRAYWFISRKQTEREMPRAWRLCTPEQAIEAHDVELISTEHGNRVFRLRSWEMGERQTADFEVYYRDNLRGFITNNSGVIGIAHGFYHIDNGNPRVYGIGIHGGKFNFFEAFGVCPDDFQLSKRGIETTETATAETAEELANVPA